jgi:hypothetical protein
MAYGFGLKSPIGCGILPHAARPACITDREAVFKRRFQFSFVTLAANP